LILLIGVYLFLRLRYRPTTETLAVDALQPPEGQEGLAKSWHGPLVIFVFITTILLWMTSGLHGLPTTVVSFLPITAFTTFQVLRSAEVRNLPWEVLLLLAGGLSLGVAVRETGLADWIITHLPTETLGTFGTTLLLAYVACVLSNVMSNTAAANIFVPLGVALGAGDPVLVVPIALACSCAMCLPVSTPPNAIAYAPGRLKATDFLVTGLLVALVGPLVCTLWSSWILG
ncbi:MAG: SLC13 family permease, partial [Planctomycetota bacterium]|nr:SLC13 family permease [Planctomycetota bacterium]